MDHFISMYIDNEMNLAEKRQFVEMVRLKQSFYTLTLELLDQEQLLRQVSFPVPLTAAEGQWRQRGKSLLSSMAKPFGIAAVGFAAAVLMMVNTVSRNPVPSMQSNRFVLFEPQASRVELTGSFSNWQPVGMKRIGNSGYWELSLDLPAGEYHYTYILDGNRRMVDPTISAVEKDDFGGENSILSLEAPI